MLCAVLQPKELFLPINLLKSLNRAGSLLFGDTPFTFVMCKIWVNRGSELSQSSTIVCLDDHSVCTQAYYFAKTIILPIISAALANGTYLICRCFRILSQFCQCPRVPRKCTWNYDNFVIVGFKVPQSVYEIIKI